MFIANSRSTTPSELGRTNWFDTMAHTGWLISSVSVVVVVAVGVWVVVGVKVKVGESLLVMV